MWIPTKDIWVPSQREFEKRWAGEPPVGHYFGSPLHPDPHAYKTTWRIWSTGYRYEGTAFFVDAPVMCTAEFKALEEQLRGFRMHYFVYNIRRPRLRNSYCAAVEHRRQFAPALADDNDPDWKGHR